MARYGKQQKQATRQRIVETAARRLKQDGIDGSGVATLMADAGLTNGAFYAHFESKEDLVATAVAAQLNAQREGFDAYPPGPAGLEQMLRDYLSVEHRDNPADGCPSAALLDEIRRCSSGTKQVYTDAVESIVDDLAARWNPEDPKSAHVMMLSIYGMLVGTLQLSRAISDGQLADALLEQGIQNALTVLGMNSHA